MPTDRHLVGVLSGLLDLGDDAVDRLLLIARRNRPLDVEEPSTAIARLRGLSRRRGPSVSVGQLADAADALDELCERWAEAASEYPQIGEAPTPPELYRASDPSTVGAAIHNDLRPRLADLHRLRAEALIGRSLPDGS